MSKRIGQYQIGRTLGSGASCKVKLGVDTKTGRKVAIKIMNKELDTETVKLVNTECEALQAIGKHTNVIQLLDKGVALYEKGKGKDEEVTYIVLEIAQGGELFDFIALSGRFTEPLARHFFYEFLCGIDHCHSSGITHRDLKPENLMLDLQYYLKIADFGFAAPVEGRDRSGALHTKLGTLNYMAPEIHLKQAYSGKSVDLFAAAIILFIMVAQHPPFTTAQPSDPFYRCLAANRADIFWKTHTKHKPEGDSFFSAELKDLIQSMLQLDPSHRPSITEVLAHPWMQGDMMTKEQVQYEFAQRQHSVNESIESDRLAKKKEMEKRNASRINDAVVRSGATGEEAKLEEEKLMVPQKELLNYEKIFAQNTEFFSSCNPDMIEEALCAHLRNTMSVEPKVNKDKYKIKFTFKTQGQDETEQQIDVCVRILKVDEEQVCVEFTKVDGPNVLFHEKFTEITKKALNFSNDSVVKIDESAVNTVIDADMGSRKQAAGEWSDDEE